MLSHKDPLAFAREVTRELNTQANERNVKLAKWEHENLAKVQIRVLRGHKDGINKCQFFADESKILTASSDGSVKVWDRHEGTIIRDFEDAHSINVAEAHCLQDGSKFISCGWDKKVHLWDMEAGTHLWSHTLADISTCCKISHNSRLVCVGTDLEKTLYILDTLTGETIYCFKDYHKSTLTSCLFSPNDERIVTTSMDRTTKFYDLCSDKCTLTLDHHSNVIANCALSQDERNLATASWDKTLQLWDIATGMYRSKGPRTLKSSHEGCVSSCEFSSDGSLLVSGSFDTTIVVWNVENAGQKLKLQGHSNWVTDVHFTQDQKWLLSCSKDKTLRLWNIEDSDRIPIVLQNKQAQELKVIKCNNCEKPFSTAELDNFQDVTFCVFCRLQKPEKSWLTFAAEEET